MEKGRIVCGCEWSLGTRAGSLTDPAGGVAACSLSVVGTLELLREMSLRKVQP